VLVLVAYPWLRELVLSMLGWVKAPHVHLGIRYLDSFIPILFLLDVSIRILNLVVFLQLRRWALEGRLVIIFLSPSGPFTLAKSVFGGWLSGLPQAFIASKCLQAFHHAAGSLRVAVICVSLAWLGLSRRI